MAEYPKYKYHATAEPVLVGSFAQEEALGDAWKDSPADFGKVTAPSFRQMQVARMGFDPFEVKAAKKEPEKEPEKEPAKEEEDDSEPELNIGPQSQRRRR